MLDGAWWDDYWAALCEGDAAGCLAAVKRIHGAGLDPLAVVDTLVVPAQALAAELVERDAWTPEQERAATSINEGLVSWLCSYAPAPDPGAPVVLVGCLDGGDDHAALLHTQVVAEVVGVSGWRTALLGADGTLEPGAADRLVREVTLLAPRAVVLTAARASSLARHRAVVAAVRGLGVPVVLTGAALGPDDVRARALGATARAGGVGDLLEVLDRLPDRVPPVVLGDPSPAEVEAAWLLDYGHEIAPYALGALARAHGLVAGGPPARWWRELAGRLDHVLGCLATALVTGDTGVVDEVDDRLRRVLTVRGAPAGVVDDLWRTLGEALAAHPTARAVLAGLTPPPVPPPVPLGPRGATSSERVDEEGGTGAADAGEHEGGLGVAAQPQA